MLEFAGVNMLAERKIKQRLVTHHAIIVFDLNVDHLRLFLHVSQFDIFIFFLS